MVPVREHSGETLADTDHLVPVRERSGETLAGTDHLVPVWEYLGETLADTDHLVPVRVCWREVENEFDRSLGRSNIISNHYADYRL